MAVEKYIQEIRRKNNVVKHDPEKELFAFKIETMVDEPEKIELFQDMYNYLNKESFHDVYYRYNNMKETFGVFQSYKDGKYGLYYIKLGSTRGSYDEGFERRKYHEFYGEYDSYSKYGEQEYTLVYLPGTIKTPSGTFDYNYSIYYFKDGSIFIDNNAAEYINKTKTDVIGQSLGKIVYSWQEFERKKIEFQKQYEEETNRREEQRIKENLRLEQERKNRSLIRRLSDKYHDWFGY